MCVFPLRLGYHNFTELDKIQATMLVHARENCVAIRDNSALLRNFKERFWS